MGLVICIGGVLLLMLLVCGEEINTFGPLHLIVLHCTLLYYIALGGQVPPTWWHTLFVCQYNTGLKHAKCARALQCMSVSCVCSTVCVFAWCELHSGHNASWQYSNTHDMTPIIPICCLVYSALNTAPQGRNSEQKCSLPSNFYFLNLGNIEWNLGKYSQPKSPCLCDTLAKIFRLRWMDRCSQISGH